MKRKWLVLTALVVLLVCAVVVNYMVNKKTGMTEEQPKETIDQGYNEAIASDLVQTETGEIDYFAVFRQDREDVRNKELEYLEDIILNSYTDAEILSDAQQQKMDIIDHMEKEFVIESQIKAKGFSDAAVTYRQGAVNVVIQSESLTQEQVAQVLDIVLRETETSAENVKISTAK